jgi:hypothetical protein
MRLLLKAEFRNIRVGGLRGASDEYATLSRAAPVASIGRHRNRRRFSQRKEFVLPINKDQASPDLEAARRFIFSASLRQGFDAQRVERTKELKANSPRAFSYCRAQQSFRARLLRERS